MEAQGFTTFSSSDSFDFGTGDFTIEIFVYFDKHFRPCCFLPK